MGWKQLPGRHLKPKTQWMDHGWIKTAKNFVLSIGFYEMKKPQLNPNSFDPAKDLPKRYALSEVLDNLPGPKTKSLQNYDGWNVHMESERYKLFKEKGCTCATCGRVGTFFMLRRATDPMAKPDSAHFNLWCEDPDGTLVMLTKDHIKPKSKGGRNNLDNYQTMCTICNLAKGAKDDNPI